MAIDLRRPSEVVTQACDEDPCQRAAEFSVPSTSYAISPLPQQDPVGLDNLAAAVGSFLPPAAGRAAARAELLAAEGDRGQALHVLAEAFSQGRLSSGEDGVRAGRALAARTYGELDEAPTRTTWSRGSSYSACWGRVSWRRAGGPGLVSP